MAESSENAEDQYHYLDQDHLEHHPLCLGDLNSVNQFQDQEYQKIFNSVGGVDYWAKICLLEEFKIQFLPQLIHLN